MASVAGVSGEPLGRYRATGSMDGQDWEARPTRHRLEHVLTRKGQATKARIVATAAELVFEHGVAGTSIDDVRRAAGVSGSQMTHYFDDKRSLVRVVIAHQAGAVLEAQQHPALGQLDSFEALDAWAELNLERQRRCEGGCMLGSLAGELVECDAETRAGLADGFERWEALLRGGLEAMRDRGELREQADPGALALALLAAVQGGSLLARIRNDITPLEAALDTALAHIRSLAA
jgi:TetR/AcrR family transcriptional regulator, transcriptional repressor for nem operon